MPEKYKEKTKKQKAKIDDIKLKSVRKAYIKLLSYSNLMLNCLLILIQISLFFIFTKYLEPYSKYFFGGSVALSLVFLIYLVNCPGKNEFKIAWLFPVIVMPLWGIVLYFITNENSGAKYISSRLKKLKKKTHKVLVEETNQGKVKKLYPKTCDIASYLLNKGGFPSYVDSSVKYFSSGESVFKDILENVKKAERFIFIEFFIIEPGKAWNELFEVLKQKVKEGVEVRLLYDYLGSVQFSSKKVVNYLNEIGIKTQCFRPFIPVYDTSLNSRDHRKIFDIDSKICYTGGFNISDEYFNFEHPRFNYWKDSAIRISGEACNSFTAMFLQLWFVQKRKVELGEAYIKSFFYKSKASLEKNGVLIPYGDDSYNKEDLAENVYYYLISRAHTYVHIMTPYLVIDNTMLNALYFAAKRGVEVSLIIPNNYDHFVTYCVGRRYIKLLIKNGVHVYGYQKGFIHAKSFVSDNKRACVGSVNLDYRSFYHHFECGTYIYSNEEIQKIEEDFQNTKKDCIEITLDEYKKIPWIQRVIGYIFRVFAPLL